MSTLLTTEVMGSTPGRHLEITGVNNGKKNPGERPNAIIKGAAMRHWALCKKQKTNFLLFLSVSYTFFNFVSTHRNGFVGFTNVVLFLLLLQVR